MSALFNLPFAAENTTPLSAPDGTEQNQAPFGEIFYAYDKNYGRGLIKLVVLRNASAGAFEPKRLVSFKTLLFGRECDGYADVNPELCVPVWDRHPTNIAQYQAFYGVLAGPTLVKTGMAADATNVITEGLWVVNGTAVTSGATTAGLIVAIDTTGATTPLANQLLTRIGRALTARTTANTRTDTLVQCRVQW